MKRYTTVLFDLDGTIIDSGEGVINSIIYSLQKYGINETDREKLKVFIGPPLKDSYHDVYGFDEEKAFEAIGFYREYYQEKGAFECYVYDGIEELLKGLKENGIATAVMTSKPEYFAKIILEKLGLAKYFDVIAGSEMDERGRGTKSEVLAYGLAQMPNATPENTVMVGDRKFDIFGAKDFMLDSVGVLFGYGSREELQKAGATYLCATAKEIEKIVLP